MKETKDPAAKADKKASKAKTPMLRDRTKAKKSANGRTA
jgi:hypothetical protein